MQTGTPTGQVTSTARQDAVLAAVILAADRGHDKGGAAAEMREIAALLNKLRTSGVSLGGIILKRTPVGYYSEDLEILLGHYVDSGFAAKQNPVSLTEEGRKLLKAVIIEERNNNPTAIRDIENILGQLI
jgi:hypothetical protein